MRRPERGLTLIELVVAIAIFAVLSAMAYRALNVVLESRGRLEQENLKWRELGLFFARLEQDVAAAAPRPVRDAASRPLPAFAGGTASPADGAIQFTRTGFAPDAQSVAPPRRIAYRLRDGAVELLTWPALDRGPRSEPRTTALLRGVQALEVRFLDRGGQWHAAWPAGGTGADPLTALPAGVEVALTLSSGERLRRLLPTAARTPR